MMRNSTQLFAFITILFVGFSVCDVLTSNDDEEVSGLYTIEGKVYPPDLYSHDENWQHDTTISINNGEYKGFLRDDGSFVISSVPSGSYVVEIHNPDYFYESVRVEINPKGKFRARKVNYIQPSQVIQVPYPLKLKALMRFKYFQTREQLKITDFLFNPMFLMMAFPLLLMLIIPKLITDPESKKEMENISFPKITGDMPEISEMITSFLNGGSKPTEKDKKATTSKQTKKRN